MDNMPMDYGCSPPFIILGYMNILLVCIAPMSRTTLGFLYRLFDNVIGSILSFWKTSRNPLDLNVNI